MLVFAVINTYLCGEKRFITDNISSTLLSANQKPLRIGKKFLVIIQIGCTVIDGIPNMIFFRKCTGRLYTCFQSCGALCIWIFTSWKPFSFNALLKESVICCQSSADCLFSFWIPRICEWSSGFLLWHLAIIYQSPGVLVQYWFLGCFPVGIFNSLSSPRWQSPEFKNDHASHIHNYFIIIKNRWFPRLENYRHNSVQRHHQGYQKLLQSSLSWVPLGYSLCMSKL